MSYIIRKLTKDYPHQQTHILYQFPLNFSGNINKDNKKGGHIDSRILALLVICLFIFHKNFSEDLIPHEREISFLLHQFLPLPTYPITHMYVKMPFLFLVGRRRGSKTGREITCWCSVYPLSWYSSPILSVAGLQISS